MLPPTNHTVATLSPLHGRTRLSGHCDQLPASLPHKGPPTGTVTGDCLPLGLASLGAMPVPVSTHKGRPRGYVPAPSLAAPLCPLLSAKGSPQAQLPAWSRPGTPLALICGPGPPPSPACSADSSPPREDTQHGTSEPRRQYDGAPGARQGWRASSGRWAVLGSPTPRPVAFPPPHPWTLKSPCPPQI